MVKPVSSICSSADSGSNASGLDCSVRVRTVGNASTGGGPFLPPLLLLRRARAHAFPSSEFELSCSVAFSASMSATGRVLPFGIIRGLLRNDAVSVVAVVVLGSIGNGDSSTTTTDSWSPSFSLSSLSEPISTAVSSDVPAVVGAARGVKRLATDEDTGTALDSFGGEGAALVSIGVGRCGGEWKVAILWRVLSGITVCARATSCVSESEWGIGTAGIDGSMGRLVAGVDGGGER